MGTQRGLQRDADAGRAPVVLAAPRLVHPPKHPPEAVTDALRRSNGNVSAAARALGQDPKTLWQRVRRNPALMPAGCVALPPGGMRREYRRAGGV